MISKEQYVPILKGKAGEFLALSKLDTVIKDSIIPLIELVPKPTTKGFEDHIISTLGYIQKNWEPHRVIYVDGYMIQDSGNLFTNIHPMKYIFDELRSKNFNILPVLNSNTGTDYKEIVKTIAKEENNGICIRVFRDSFDNIENFLVDCLDFFEIEPSSVDLVIDLRDIGNLNNLEIYSLTIETLNNLNFLSNWRNLILSGSSLPIDLVALKPDQIHILPRKEWIVWKKIFENGKVERLPIFSDYAISHPMLSNYDSTYPNASASIRYTQEIEHYIYRGRGTRQKGFEQFFDLSESLINSSDYYGESHCAGDEYIKKCGTEKKKPGSLQTWRWVGTNHHLTLVINQLRQFFRDFNASRTS
jgi:hypothetical protein